MEDTRVVRVWGLLKVAFGVVPVVAGLDKFAGLLADWEGYVGPLARSLLPFSVPVFLKLVGLVEIAAGVLVLLPRTTRLGAYVVAAWLLAIALQLLTMGRFLDVAVRDVVLALAAFSLGQLDAARAAAPRRHGSGQASIVVGRPASVSSPTQ